MKYTFLFKDFIDPDNDYHWWMYSIGLALSDLITINQMLNEEFTAEKSRKQDRSRAFFLFKIGVSFLREAIKLHSSYHNQWGNYHRKINGYQEGYKKIENLSKDKKLKGVYNSIKLEEIKDARDNIFHYTTDKNDRNKLKKIVKKLKDENPDFSITFRLRGNILSLIYPYSEQAQFQGFFNFYEYSTLDGLQEKTQDLLELMRTYIEILKAILDDFVQKKANELNIKVEYDIF